VGEPGRRRLEPPISHEFTGCGSAFYAPLPRALVRSSWERNYDV
jgi:hypothetical protein